MAWDRWWFSGRVAYVADDRECEGDCKVGGGAWGFFSAPDLAPPSGPELSPLLLPGWAGSGPAPGLQLLIAPKPKLLRKVSSRQAADDRGSIEQEGQAEASSTGRRGQAWAQRGQGTGGTCYGGKWQGRLEASGREVSHCREIGRAAGRQVQAQGSRGRGKVILGAGGRRAYTVMEGGKGQGSGPLPSTAIFPDTVVGGWI